MGQQYLRGITYAKAQNQESELRKRFNKDIRRGNENEGKAQKEYTARYYAYKVKCIFEWPPKHTFIGASPDGVVSCECCAGFGVLEIKCPTKDNLKKCLDDNGQLRKDDK